MKKILEEISLAESPANQRAIRISLKCTYGKDGIKISKSKHYHAIKVRVPQHCIVYCGINSLLLIFLYCLKVNTANYFALGYEDLYQTLKKKKIFFVCVSCCTKHECMFQA